MDLQPFPTPDADASPAPLFEVPPGAELEQAAVPEAFGPELEPAAVPELFEQPAAPSAGGAALGAAPAEPAARATTGRPVTPGALGARKRFRDKLRRSRTQEEVRLALEYARAAELGDVGPEVQRLLLERTKEAGSSEALAAALEWGRWAGAGDAQGAAGPAPRSAGAPGGATAAGPAVEVLPPEPPPRPLYLGRDAERVALFAESAAPLVAALAKLTAGKRLDLTGAVNVVVLEGTPHERRVTGDQRGRISTLLGVLLADLLPEDLGAEGGPDAEPPSPVWELSVLGGMLAVAALPSPVGAVQSAARVVLRGSQGAARLAGALVGRLRRRRG